MSISTAWQAYLQELATSLVALEEERAQWLTQQSQALDPNSGSFRRMTAARRAETRLEQLNPEEQALLKLVRALKPLDQLEVRQLKAEIRNARRSCG